MFQCQSLGRPLGPSPGIEARLRGPGPQGKAHAPQLRPYATLTVRFKALPWRAEWPPCGVTVASRVNCRKAVRNRCSKILADQWRRRRGFCCSCSWRVLIVPNLIPQEVYRAKIEEEASQALGRKVTVTGNISVGIFPRHRSPRGRLHHRQPGRVWRRALRLDEGTARRRRALAALLPAMSRSRNSCWSSRPSALVSLEDGKNNWTFTPAAAPPSLTQARHRAAPWALPSAMCASRRATSPSTTARTRTVQTLSDLNLSADMQALDKPLSFNAEGFADDLAFKLESKHGQSESDDGRPRLARRDQARDRPDQDRR